MHVVVEVMGRVAFNIYAGFYKAAMGIGPLQASLHYPFRRVLAWTLLPIDLEILILHR